MEWMAEKKGARIRISLFFSFALLTMASSSFAAGEICSSDSFNDTLSLAAIATIATAALIAACYMFGEFFSSARMLTWAKTEIFQVFVSLVLVGALLGLVGTFCSLKIGDVSQVLTPDFAGASSMPAAYKDYPGDSLYSGASLYLENLMAVAHSNMRSVRYSLGAYEIRTTFRTMECKNDCWVSLVSSDSSPHGGESALLALENNLLGTATASYFTAMFQYFSLQYVYQGVFLTFLPLAIVIRSVPFMRHFGGALIAIFLSLYILYPLLLVANSVVAPGLAGGTPASIFLKDGCRGTDAFRYTGSGSGGMNCVATIDPGGKVKYDEENLEGDVGFFLTYDEPEPAPLAEQVRASAIIFIATVFLGALDWLVIIAMARGISQLLGEEVDISRLGQMV